MSNEIVKRDESSAMISMIERVAQNPDADIEKLERLLSMQERVMAKNAEMEFTRAMSAAQSNMGRISADATNPQTRSKYATYGKLDKVLRPVYTDNGFSLSFGTEKSDLEGHLRVICHVSHVSGHTRMYSVDMPSDGKGAKGGDVMTKTHATGAAMSYGMRYLLKLIFNVAIGEEDNDGNEDVEGLEDAIANIESAEDMQALQATFKASWSAFTDKSSRAILTRVKDKRKKELSNG